MSKMPAKGTLRAKWQGLSGWLKRLRADLRERHEMAAENLFLRRQLRLYLDAEEERLQRQRRKQARQQAKRCAADRGKADRS